MEVRVVRVGSSREAVVSIRPHEAVHDLQIQAWHALFAPHQPDHRHPTPSLATASAVQPWGAQRVLLSIPGCDATPLDPATPLCDTPLESGGTVTASLLPPAPLAPAAYTLDHYPHALALSPCGTALAVASSLSLSLWDTPRGTLLWQHPLGAIDAPDGLTFSPCSAMLAVSHGTALEVWRCSGGGVRLESIPAAHSNAILTAAWGHHCRTAAGRRAAGPEERHFPGGLLITSGTDMVVCIRGHIGAALEEEAEACSGGEIPDCARLVLLHTLVGHAGPVSGVGVCGDVVVSAGWDCTLRVWGVGRGELRACIAGHAVPIHGVVVEDGGGGGGGGAPPRAVTCAADGEVKVWCLSTRACLASARHTAKLLRVSVSHGVIACLSRSGEIALWAMPGGGGGGNIGAACLRELEPGFELPKDAAGLAMGSHPPHLFALSKNTVVVREVAPLQ